MNVNSELIKKMSLCFSPSGREDNIREFIKEEIKDFVDEINEDAMGNLIARKKGTGKKILFLAHMDEIGMMVTNVGDNGFLRFSCLRELDPCMLLGQRVVFNNGFEGCICKEKSEDESKPEISKMYIDIAGTCSDFVKKNFEAGDMCVLKSDYYEVDDNIICKAADNRIGCYILTEVMKKQIETNNDIYYVFTAQEEVGYRGAKTAGYQIYPDVCAVIDATPTTDSHVVAKTNVSLGSGAAIKIKERYMITNNKLKKFLIETAEKNNIKYQYEILELWGTDSTAVQYSREGVPSCGISIPTRNIHSPNEIVNKRDIIECIKLVQAFIKTYV